MPKALNKFQRQFYDRAHQQQKTDLASLADMRLSDHISSTQYKEAMMDSLKQYYIQLALVAKGGRPLISRDRQDIGRFLGVQKSYLDEFSNKIDQYKAKALATDLGVLSNSSSYANAWGVFTRFALPAALADALPALPGIDCLGGMSCGCWLEWAAFEKTVEVYWHVNPMKEPHCILCDGFTVEWSPLSLDVDELDQDLLDEEQDFLYA